MKLRLLALGAFMICLTSCFDVIETFNIKEDGSGTYEVKMDMSRTLGLLAMMKQGANDGKTKEKIDTVIYTNSITDTSTVLTNEEKMVLGKSYTKVHMDEEEGEGYVNMYYPFANGKELEIIQKAMSKTGNNQGIKNTLGKAFGKEASAAAASDDGKDASLPTSNFAYSLTTNSLVRKVKPSSKVDEPKSSDEQIPPQLKEMMKITYTTTINLPRPVKNFKGNGTLSADKKQLKFNKSVDMDSKLAPADFDFSIDY